MDNLRSLMVLLAVVVHSASSYSRFTDAWAVNDVNAPGIDFFMRTAGFVTMPVLFFLAGFFALPSIRKRSTWEFIRHKLLYIGLPWLFWVLLLAPVHRIVFHYSRAGSAVGWRDVQSMILQPLKSFFSLHTGFMRANTDFNQYHLWFISLLLVFFIVFALLHRAASAGTFQIIPPTGDRNPTGIFVMVVWLAAGMGSTALTLAVHSLISPVFEAQPWFIIGSFIQFQPTQIFLYITCFALGIAACHQEWFARSRIIDPWWVWVALSTGLWLAFAWIAGWAARQTPLLGGAAYLFSRSVVFFSVLLTLLSLGKRFLDRSGTISRGLSNNSYTIYLVHIAFVYAAQWILLFLTGYSVYVKIAFASLSATLLSYLFSRFIIKPLAGAGLGLLKARAGDASVLDEQPG